MAEVYDFIIQDLNDAIAEPALPLSPKSTGVLPGKVTRTAAWHVLAKVYLARAGSAAKKADDYKNAYNSATEVINKSGLSLLPDFGQGF
ncbi:hypothetical protein LWM68_27670 [Niabella sp. W65]|nr:hypothetical protein [Niabella sp. W65]MCH7366215.1 hypothetical protein [Niabella sp. W65]